LCMAFLCAQWRLQVEGDACGISPDLFSKEFYRGEPPLVLVVGGNVMLSRLCREDKAQRTSCHSDSKALQIAHGSRAAEKLQRDLSLSSW